MKSGFYMTTSSVAGLRRSFKALLKAKLAPKKAQSLVGGLMLAGLLHYSFLNPGKTITSEKYAQQLKTEMPAASPGQQKWLNSSL